MYQFVITAVVLATSWDSTKASESPEAAAEKSAAAQSPKAAAEKPAAAQSPKAAAEKAAFFQSPKAAANRLVIPESPKAAADTLVITPSPKAPSGKPALSQSPKAAADKTAAESDSPVAVVSHKRRTSLRMTLTKLRPTDTSIALLYAVAIVWVVLNASTHLPQVVSLQQALGDAETSNELFQKLVRREPCLHV